MTTVGNTFGGSSGRKTFKSLLASLLPYNPNEAPGDSRSEIDDYCSQIQTSVENRRYEPSLPRGKMSLAKAHGVPRFITFPTFQDQCVYHHCVFQLEKGDQFIHRVSNAFGGWHLPHPHREQERDEVDRLEESFSEQYLESPYWSPAVNPIRYRRIWREYAYYVYLQSMNLPDYAAVHIDIANFYDSIDLPRLERLVRARANQDTHPIVDLLFHFLQGYDRRQLGYSTRAVGLPHEELTESSGVLSNLYLVDYDKRMMEFCSSQSPEYRYMRYSDDQLFSVPSMDHARSSIYKASEELRELGLNISAPKVRIFNSTAEIDDYWNFSIFNESRIFAEQHDASELCRYYLDRRKNYPDDVWRHDLMRNAIIQSLLKPWRDWEVRQEFVRFIIGNPSELYSFTDHQLSKFYSASNPEQRSRLLSWIAQAIQSEHPFTKFKLHVVRFLQTKKISAEESGLSDESIASLVNQCRF